MVRSSSSHTRCRSPGHVRAYPYWKSMISRTIPMRAAVQSSHISPWSALCCLLPLLLPSGRLARVTSFLFLSPCCRLVPLLSVSLPWDALLGHRALCRLRAGTLDLAHVNGKKSRAKVRCCLFCNKKTWASYIHVLGECQISFRPELCDAAEPLSPRERALWLLNMPPHERLFPAAACVALTIERESKRFWERAG